MRSIAAVHLLSFGASKACNLLFLNHLYVDRTDLFDIEPFNFGGYIFGGMRIIMGGKMYALKHSALG